MNILLAAGEMAPFVRIGERADAIADLSGELRRLGHDVTVVLPFYRAIREGKAAKFKKSKIRFSVPMGTARMPCEVLEARAPNGVTVLFVSRDEYFDRSGIYGVDGRDYQDNAARFLFFTKCVVELAGRPEGAPDILHVNSWETALAPVMVRERRLPVRTVLTPHSLEFQGNFWSYDFALTNLPGEYFSARGVEYYGSLNCLKGGLMFADAVVFPGELMVNAVQTPEHGCGLESVLAEHRHKLCGIPSAEGLEEWDPAADDALTAKFTAHKPATRRKNRAALFKAAGWDETDGPAFVVFTGASTGGSAVLLGALDRILTDAVRLLVLGPVEDSLRLELEVARRKHRGRFTHQADFKKSLARQALAGADVLLVPGVVEPRAVWLRRALRYGAFPVVRQSGGLFQLVRDWEPVRNEGNGVVFSSGTVDGLVDAVRRTTRILSDKTQADALRDRALGMDFSREAVARGHEALYERLLGRGSATRAA